MLATTSRTKKQYRPDVESVEQRLFLSAGLHMPHIHHVHPGHNFNPPHIVPPHVPHAVHPSGHVTAPPPPRVIISPPAPAPTPTPTPAPTSNLNQSVLHFAQSQIGTQVGDGQCTSLAVSALNAAGAQGLPWNSGPDTDYVWGKLDATLTAGSHSTANIAAGDIIQYRDVKIVDTNTGSWMSATHHTSVVTGVSGNTLTVLEQNVNGNMTVQSSTLNLDGLQQGTMWVYRPIA